MFLYSVKRVKKRTKVLFWAKMVENDHKVVILSNKKNILYNIKGSPVKRLPFGNNSSKKVGGGWDYLRTTFWVHSAYGWQKVGKGSPKLGLPLGLPFYTRYYVIQGSGFWVQKYQFDLC